MSKPFEFNGIAVKTPDTFQPSMSTTSTEDSDRTQDLVMHNTPMGTIQNAEFEWQYIELEEAALILQQIVNKAEYSLRYPEPLSGRWEVNTFYTTNYSLGTHMISNGKSVWESLSFNAVRIKPV